MASSLTTLHSRARFRRWFGVHLLAAVGLFLAGFVLGVAVIEAIPLETLARYATGVESPLPDRITTWTIFANNVLAMSMLLAGSVTLGLLTVVGLFFNGLVVGVVGNAALQATSPVVVLALIVPHGILELPALLTAGAIGLRVPHRVSRYLLGYDETPLSRVELYEVAVLVVLVTAALAVAAFVEAEYTRQVADLVR
ncbi:MAG: stage II sporulation protein M [Haloarculaceae archaeon]